jgi:hypothetical protein
MNYRVLDRIDLRISEVSLARLFLPYESVVFLEESSK